MQNTHPYRQGVIYALVTAVCLGSVTTQAKLFYAEGGNAMTLMLARFFISTLVFGALISIRQQSLRVSRGNRLGVFLVGGIWSAAMIFYLLSVETISVSLAVLILYAYPLLVLLYSIARGQLPASLRLIFLFLLAFLGLYLTLSSTVMTLDARGLMYAALACLGAAFTFIKGAKVAVLLNPLIMTFWVNLVGLIMILPLVYPSFVLITSTAGISALSLATAFYVIAILCQFQALARLPAATAAFILNLEPVVSILLAVFILKEQLSTMQWLGVILVISVLVATIGTSAGRNKPVKAA